MKRLFFCLFIIVITFSINTTVFADNGSTIVYITRTGEKYHQEWCSYLKSSFEISLEEAVEKGYTRCSRCKPPLYDGGVTQPTPRPTSTHKLYDGSVTLPTLRPASTPRPTATTTYYRASSPAGSTVPSAQWQSIVWPIAAFLGLCSTLLLLNKCRVNRETIDKLKTSKWDLQEQVNTLAKDNAQLRKTVYDAQKELYTKYYAGRNILKICNAPEKSCVSDDGFPSEIDELEWGCYTFFVSNVFPGYTGSCFHKKHGCSGAIYSRNAVEVVGMRPCRRCNPELPDLTWYYEYLKIEKIKREFDIK